MAQEDYRPLPMWEIAKHLKSEDHNPNAHPETGRIFRSGSIALTQRWLWKFVNEYGRGEDEPFVLTLSRDGIIQCRMEVS
jgi:hypothetical protein